MEGVRITVRDLIQNIEGNLDVYALWIHLSLSLSLGADMYSVCSLFRMKTKEDVLSPIFYPYSYPSRAQGSREG